MAKNYGLNLDSRLSASLEVYFSNKVADNIFDRYPSLRKLWADRKETDGGESISEAITYLVNSNVTALSTPYQEVDTTPQDNETTLNDRLRIYAAPVTISDVELDENRGRKIFNLLEQKMDNAMWSLRRTLNTDLWATSQSGGKINTFQQLVATTGTIHSLASASYWQAITTASGSFASRGLDDMRSTFNQCSVEGDMPPNMIVTDRATHERYEKFGQTGSTVYLPATTTEHDLNLGFNTVRFRGVPIFYDLAAPSGEMYFLNTNHTKLVVSRHHNFRVGKFIRPHNAIVQTAIITMRGQLFTSNRRLNGKMTSITD